MTRHLTEDELHELADDSLAPERRAVVERHVAACAECTGEVERVRVLLARVARLPRQVEPPRDLWRDIATEVRRPRIAAEPAPGAPSRPWWARRGWLAAAAVLLVALSSSVTLLLSGRGTSNESPAAAAPPLPTAPYHLAHDASAVEASYRSVIDDLVAAVEAQRETLSPETLATVERTLRVIDDAIAETRDALERDPNNRVLLDLLSTGYERKVELLQRATKIATQL